MRNVKTHLKHKHSNKNMGNIAAMSSALYGIQMISENFDVTVKTVRRSLKYTVVCLFVCGISLMSGQLFNELFPDCTRSCSSQVVLRHRGGDRIYEMRCLFVAVGPNARSIVLPHWDNMS